MSLIIGRANKGNVIILGDTKLTFYNNKNSNPYVDGCLKVYSVNDTLAFGFAGTVEHFEIALEELLQCKSPDEIANVALKLKSEKHLDFDLLIGEAGNDYLTLLKGKQITKQIVGYIGDKDAYEKYQSNFNSNNGAIPPEEGRASIQISRQPEPLWENEIYSKMFHAFKNTITNAKIPSVGGISVPLCTDKGKFRYMNYVDIISDPLDLSQFSDKPKVIEFGTAEYGSFSVEFSDTSPHGGSPKDIGFYFLQGGFGLIFCENKNMLKKPKVILAKNPAYWVLNSSFEYGSGVASGYATPDHCGIAGEQLLTTGNWKDALFCYELGKDDKSLPNRPAVYDRFMSGYAVALFNCGKTIEALKTLETAIAANSISPRCGEYLAKIQSALQLK